MKQEGVVADGEWGIGGLGGGGDRDIVIAHD
jgi:hypothetical protein